MEFPEKTPKQLWEEELSFPDIESGGPWEKYDEVLGMVKWMVWARDRLSFCLDHVEHLTAKLAKQGETLRIQSAALQGYEAREKLRQSKSVQTRDLGEEVVFTGVRRELTARVVAIHIDKGGVRYDVVYWSGLERRLIRVSPEEIKVVDDILPHRLGDGPSSIAEKTKYEIDVKAFMKS